MRSRHRSHNHQSNSVPSQSLTPDSGQKSNHNGESAGAKPQSTIKKSTVTSVVVKPSRDEVAAMAYQIYLREGRPQGRDLQHWLEAESQLAASAPLTIKTEMTVKTETTVKNEVGTTAKTLKLLTK